MSTAPATPVARQDRFPAGWNRRPPFIGIADRFASLLTGSVEVDALNRAFAGDGRVSDLRFAAQTPELIADGLHYEERIARRGLIATRIDDPHDWFNALIWLQHTELKRAMNARQAADVARVGRAQRTRGQCALTHFDEAGAIVWIASPDALAAWDAHDWKTLFRARRDEWGSCIAITIVGHALYEYALQHEAMPVAKALAVAVDADAIRARRASASAGSPTVSAIVAGWPQAERSIAAEIRSGRLLADPQELRPLPLAGIPGWQPGAHAADFFEATPCFRPLRDGRRYPSPAKVVPPGNARAVRAIA